LQFFKIIKIIKIIKIKIFLRRSLKKDKSFLDEAFRLNMILI